MPVQIVRMTKKDEGVPAVYAAENACWTRTKKLIKARIPILEWLPHYNCKEDLVSDSISGFTLACIHVPQGLAFAVLANVDPILGLYTACFSTLIYCVFGTAHIGSFGPVAIASMLIGEAVAEKSGGAYSNNEISSAITFNIGIYYMIAFLLRLGVLASIFTKPLSSGFITGCTIHVVFKNIKLLLGLKYKNEYGILNLYNNINNLCSHLNEVNVPTVIMSVCVLTALVLNITVLKPLVSRCTKVILPVEGIVMVLAIIVSYAFSLGDLGVPMVGYVPTGLPEFRLPSMSAALDLWAPALVVATINYSTTTSMTMMFNKDLRTNQDLFALALSNLACCNVQCISIGNSMMRTVIATALGVRTLLSSIISSFFLIFVIFFAGPLFSPLPNCVLGSIIMVGAVLLVISRLREVPSIFRSSLENAFIWFVTLCFVLVVDIDYGLIVGSVLTLRQMLRQRSRDMESAEKIKDKASESLIDKVPNNQTELPI